MSEKYLRYPVVDTNVFKKFSRQNPSQSGVGIVNTAYPGQNMGLSLEDVKALIDNSEKVVGVVFQSAVGIVNPDIKFPNTAKYLLGFTFSKIANLTDTFNLLLNEEKAITGASSFAYSTRDGSPSQLSYFEFPRVIGGSTAMTIDYTSLVGGETIVFTAHYV